MPTAAGGGSMSTGSTSSTTHHGVEVPTSLSHILPFPAFACEWLKQDMVLVAGGGGASKTGVPNGVIIYKVCFLCVGVCAVSDRGGLPALARYIRLCMSTTPMSTCTFTHSPTPSLCVSVCRSVCGGGGLPALGRNVCLTRLCMSTTPMSTSHSYTHPTPSHAHRH